MLVALMQKSVWDVSRLSFSVLILSPHGQSHTRVCTFIMDMLDLGKQNISFCSLLSGFKCPICSKSVASDEMEMHFIMCLSKPRLSYNGEGLAGAGGGGGFWAASAPCLRAGRARGAGQGGSPSGG